MALSNSVEAKYHEAVSDICRQQSEVKLANLQLASKDWGIEWRGQAIGRQESIAEVFELCELTLPQTQVAANV